MRVLPSYTTRPKRNVSDMDHIYISQAEYDLIPDKVATRERSDGCYCATKEQVDNNDIYVVDFDGLFELKEKYHGSKQIVSLFIDVPLDECERRMRNRGDSEDKIRQRTQDSISTNTKENINMCDVVFNGMSPFLHAMVYETIRRCEIYYDVQN